MTPETTPQSEKKPLTAKQRQAIVCLAEGNTIVLTAKVVGVSEKSVDTWKKLPHFREALRQAERELYDDAMSLLKRTAKASIATLIRNMDSKVSSYVQVQAASKLLDLSMEITVSQEIEQRLDALEEMAKSA